MFLIVILMAYQNGVLASLRYRMTDSPAAFYGAVHKRLSPGDSMGRFREVLGPGEEVIGQRREKLLSASRHFMVQSPDAYPDGVEEADVFIEYRVGLNTGYQFQFRDGRVINFNPNDYSNYRPVTVLGR
jgi:hypothetical protein